MFDIDVCQSVELLGRSVSGRQLARRKTELTTRALLLQSGSPRPESSRLSLAYRLKVGLETIAYLVPYQDQTTAQSKPFTGGSHFQHPGHAQTFLQRGGIQKPHGHQRQVANLRN